MFQASSARRTFCRAVSSVKGGSGGRGCRVGHEMRPSIQSSIRRRGDGNVRRQNEALRIYEFFACEPARFKDFVGIDGDVLSRWLWL